MKVTLTNLYGFGLSQRKLRCQKYIFLLPNNLEKTNELKFYETFPTKLGSGKSDGPRISIEATHTRLLQASLHKICYMRTRAPLLHLKTPAPDKSIC